MSAEGAEHGFELLDGLSDAILVVDEGGVVVFANAQVPPLFGYAPDEVVGQPIEVLLPEDARDRHASHVGQFLQAPRARPMGSGFELDARHKDGHRLPVEVSLGPSAWRGRRLVLASVRDVTSRRRALEDMRRSREELDITLESIGDGVLVADVQGRVVRMNGVAERLTGWSTASARGLPSETVLRLENEDTRARVESPVVVALRDERVVGLANHTLLLARDGSERPIADCGAPILDREGRLRGVVVVFRDQSTERALEKSLRESERYARELFEAAPDAQLIVDEQGAVREANAGATRLLGYPSPALQGTPLDRLIPSIPLQAQADGAPRAPTRLAAVRADGREVPVEVSLSPVSGGLVAAALRDVTERERMEAARAAAQREAEEARAALEALFDAIPDPVVVVDPEGIIQSVNHVRPPRTVAEVIGTSCFAYVSPEDQPRIRQALRSALAGVPATYEVSARALDGSTRWYASHVGPIKRGGAIAGAVIVTREVTETRRLTAQLVASDRLSSMGSLAAAVAHEINNPLAAVIANLDLAQQAVVEHGGQPDAAPELLAELSDARDAAERIRAIVRDLRVFSRDEDRTTGPVDVRRALQTTARLAMPEIRHRARLVERYGEVPLAEGNELRLGQVFLNLLVNAAQAIPAGRASANEIRISTYTSPAGEVVAEIADTGCGMPPEVLSRLFQPFFTTKPAGQGTGIGLTICDRILRELKGRLEVESKVGEGSTFRVHLPRDRREAAVQPGPRSPSGRPAGTEDARPTTAPPRRGRILVVDDEPAIGGVLRRALSGHDITAETSSSAALERLRSGETFDLILCDVTMPETTGPALVEELARFAPVQAERVVFLTGGAFSEELRQALERTPNLRLEKPFDAKGLRALVAERLAAPKG